MGEFVGNYWPVAIEDLSVLGEIEEGDLDEAHGYLGVDSWVGMQFVDGEVEVRDKNAALVTQDTTARLLQSYIIPFSRFLK